MIVSVGQLALELKTLYSGLSWSLNLSLNLTLSRIWVRDEVWVCVKLKCLNKSWFVGLICRVDLPSGKVWVGKFKHEITQPGLNSII